jgi:hypothetical protein
MATIGMTSATGLPVIPKRAIPCTDGTLGLRIQDISLSLRIILV